MAGAGKVASFPATVCELAQSAGKEWESPMSVQGKVKRKGRTLTQRGFNFDAAAMQVSNTPHSRQAQAGPVRSGSEEGIKNAAAIFVANATACVRYFNHSAGKFIHAIVI